MSRILENSENQITNGFNAQKHVAVDVVKKMNQLANIISHSDGKVVWVQTGQKNNKGSNGNASYGNAVKIKHNNGYYTLYAHLARVDVRVGQSVKKGQVIGYMGNTGNSYGAHLHFEVRNEKDVRINPTSYIDKDLPGTTKISKKVLYQSYDNAKKMWLPNVAVATNDYAGNFGNSMGGIYADKYRLRVHDKKKGYWLPWVENRKDYAGNLGNDIDGVQIENATYRVHIKNGSWLPWVSKVDNSSSGYAGIYGQSIDAIQIK